MLHVYEPLQRQTGLDSHFGALGEAHVVGVVLDFFEQPGSGQVLGDGLAAVKAVHADVHSGTFGDGGIVVENVNGLEIVLLAEHVVVLVMRGGYLEAACAELDVDIAVFDNGNHAAHQRHDYFLALEPLVFGILGVYAHGRVAHDGLGTGGCDHRIPTLGIIGHIIFKVVELGLLGFEEYLVVADGRKVFGVPVDHAQTTVNQSFLI